MSRIWTHVINLSPALYLRLKVLTDLCYFFVGGSAESHYISDSGCASLSKELNKVLRLLRLKEAGTGSLSHQMWSSFTPTFVREVWLWVTNLKHWSIFGFWWIFFQNVKNSFHGKVNWSKYLGWPQLFEHWQRGRSRRLNPHGDYFNQLLPPASQGLLTKKSNIRGYFSPSGVFIWKSLMQRKRMIRRHLIYLMFCSIVTEATIGTTKNTPYLWDNLFSLLKCQTVVLQR